ncbi:MAG TPA: pitrilysin family protein [Vicinamibacterales bacterium]|nr:pitrilysin family protein [Vicinamibacterales bacterium]
MTKVVLSFLLLLAPAAALAQTAPFKVPVEYFTLPNGLKVVVSEDRTAPVALVEVMYNIGFRSEPKGRTGFAHLFEHMMFQGSANVKKMEHVAIMQQAGGVVNGSTRLDYTNYFQVLPSNALEVALWLEADRMRSLDVSAENLENQQNVVSEEVRVNVLNQPHAAFEWLEIWQRANVNWANAHNFYGDLADLEAATLEDVQSFFKTYYAPNNAVLVVVGDVSVADVRRLAEKHFGGIPRQPLPKPIDDAEPPQKEEKRFSREDSLARTPALAVAWHLPPRMSKDFFALSVLDPLLVSDESARLHRKLVREDRLAMSVIGAFNFLGNNWDVRGPMLFTLRVDYLNDKTAAEVLAAIDGVLGEVREKGITEAELKQAKTALRSSFLEDMEGGFMPRFGRANLLAAFALFDDDPRRINTILEELEKVTVEDVKAAASRWFVKTNQTSIDSRPAAKPTAPGGGR